MKLGIRLTVYLVGAVIGIMIVFGYLSIQQDRKNLIRELRIGMRGFGEAIQETLSDIYGDERNLKETQKFINSIGPRENIHGVIVYDVSGKPVAVSPSLEEVEGLAEINLAKVLAEGEEMDGLIRRPGHLIYYRTEPIFNSEARLVGAFLLARQGAELTEAIETRGNRIVVTTAMLVLLICLLIFAMVRSKISRPINELIVRIRALGAGNWEQHLEIAGRDEVSGLAKEFNRMSERLRDTHAFLAKEQEETLRLERELRHSEKLASVGQLAAGVAHEIGTPLNIIGGRAEYLLRRKRTDEEVEENLRIIRSQIDRITGIVRHLLEFSRKKELSLRTVDVASMLENVKKLFEHKIMEKGIKVELAVPETLPGIKADPDLLQQVFINLYQNSLDVLDSGGTIKIQTQVMSNSDSLSNNASDGSWLRISFEDNGPGIPAKDIDRLFEPFFTTKDIGQGTGLGLSVTYGIIKEHGGEIRVESEQGGFTRFIISLPFSRQGAERDIGGIRL